MRPASLAGIGAALAALLTAGAAHGQLLDPQAEPRLQPLPLPKARTLPPASGFYAGSEGLPPADPKAPDYWRADPKLYAGFEFGPHFGVEMKFTNPDYREGLRYRGHGPRLAESVTLGAHGYNVDLVGRARLPVNERLSAFATMGVAADVRQRHDGKTADIGPVGSVGASYKLNRKQTVTAEIPLGIAAKRLGGNGGALKLGF